MRIASEDRPRNVLAKRFVQEDENKVRGNWGGKLDFVLSGLGYAVGLGNVWRFPYLCFKNGGGAFLIPYVIFLFIVGIPLSLAELTLGQFTSNGPMSCWECTPIFRGIGAGMVLVSAMVGTYYNVLITWAFWYFFDSFKLTLPWKRCGAWATDLCTEFLSPITRANCTGELVAYTNGTCFNKTSRRLYGIYNKTLAAEFDIHEKQPAAIYLQRVGLRTAFSPGLHALGYPRWDMTLLLLLAWILVFLAISKGVKSSGKVVYFTTLFPYLVLSLLFVNMLLTDGYTNGIYFFLKPEFYRLKEVQVWKDAAVQIFFSLGLCWGGLSAMASYNRFHTDIVRDTLIVCFGNCVTSFFAGLVIFGYLGAWAKTLGIPVKSVVEEGVTLAFIVYPQAITTLPGSPFWAVSFFLMLITLGMDTQFTLIETVVTGTVDLYPPLRKYKMYLAAGVCCAFFLIGISMTTDGGSYLITLMDAFACGWNVMILGVLVCLAITLYNPMRFSKDVGVMIRNKTLCCLNWNIFKWYFIVCWSGLSPICLLITALYTMINPKFPTHGKYIYPPWAIAIGWCLTFIVIVAVIIGMILVIFTMSGPLMKRLKNAMKPSPLWGPALLEHRKLINYVDGFVVDIPSPKKAVLVEVPASKSPKAST